METNKEFRAYTLPKERRRMGGIFALSAPFLYFRNLYLIIKQED